MALELGQAWRHDTERTAAEVGISPKTLRSWLRINLPRSPAEKHQRWELDEAAADAVRRHFS